MSEILGIQELFNKLDSIIPETQQALMRGGMIIEATAKEFCPVDTGLLRNSISTELVDKCTVDVGTNIEYAADVEFGTGIYGPGGEDEDFS